MNSTLNVQSILKNNKIGVSKLKRFLWLQYKDLLSRHQFLCLINVCICWLWDETWMLWIPKEHLNCVKFLVIRSLYSSNRSGFNYCHNYTTTSSHASSWIEFSICSRRFNFGMCQFRQLWLLIKSHLSPNLFFELNNLVIYQLH